MFFALSTDWFPNSGPVPAIYTTLIPQEWSGATSCSRTQEYRIGGPIPDDEQVMSALLQCDNYIQEVKRNLSVGPCRCWSCFSIEFRKSKPSNLGVQSQRICAFQWANQNSNSILVADAKRGKNVSRNSGWVLFYFWLDDKVTRLKATRT